MSKTNRCLNFIKGVAIMMIIVLHGEFPTYAGSIINMFARCGVPIFFMISGYFLFKENGEQYSNKKFKKKILRTFGLVIIYFVVNIAYEVVKGSMTVGFKKTIEMGLGQITVKSILETIFLNRTIIGVGGWFLTSMLVAYIILYFINKYNLYSKFYYLIFPLLATQFALSYIPHLMGHDIDCWYYRNAYFVALPCMLLGHFIHKNKEKFTKKYPNNIAIFISLLIAGTLISSLERIFIGGFSLYIGSILLAIVIFGYGVVNPKKYVLHIVEWIGARITFYIFIIHPLVIENVINLAKRFTNYNIAIQFVIPIINIIVTVILSYLVYKLFNLKKGRINEQ